MQRLRNISRIGLLAQSSVWRLLSLLYTGQRRSDVVRMRPDDVSGGSIKVTQQKTGAKLDIPIHPKLQAELNAWQDVGAGTFLATEYGKPFSVNGFYNNFSEWCQEAG